MLFFYLATFCSLLFGIKVNLPNFYEDALDKKQTDAVKGLFILMVFLSHIMLEIRVSGFRPVGVSDLVGFHIRSEFGQLIVVLFLFYSGYGVMKAIKDKGKSYLDHFPRRRLLTTLLNYDVAVVCYVVLNLLFGVGMSMKQVGGAFIGWNSVGNSNWYIFVILCCYSVTWISGKLFPRNAVGIFLMTTFLVFLGEVTLAFLKDNQTWWYNTMLCYPAGMFLSMHKQRLTFFFKHYYWYILGVLLIVFLFLHVSKGIPSPLGIAYNVKSIVFCFLVVLTTLKVKIGNRFLYWLGASVFPIYIYQRLPMRAFRFWAGDAWICSNPYLFIILSTAITCLIAYFYKYWQIKLK